MAAAHVQFLGGASSLASAHTTTVLSPASKTVTVGDVIFVGFNSYDNVTPTGVTDNLGNTYVRSERVTRAEATADLWYAPVTVGGSITTITISHPSSAYTLILASEFSGVGTSSAAGGGLTGTTGVRTWVNNKTVPASGLAVGVAAQNGTATHTAGAASGSPSTSISKSGQIDAGASTFTLSLCYAIPSTSPVTGFTGTTTSNASGAWAGAGGLFNPSAIAAVPPNFLPFFWA